MKLLYTLFTVLAFSIVSINVNAKGYDFKAGLWETTTTMEFKGLPAEVAAKMKMPPQTSKQCLKAVDKMFESDNRCKYTKKKISAKKMQITFECTEAGKTMKGKGEATFSGNKFSSWTEIETPQGSGGTMTIKSNINAKYVGACKEK